MARAVAFSRWELPEKQFETVEEHLRDCPDCAKAVQALEQAEALVDQPTADGSAPQEFASRVMARIRGWESAQTWKHRRRLALRAAACLAVSLLPISAFVARRHPPAPPEIVATLDVVSIQTTNGHAANQETIDLGVAEQLQHEFANTLAALEVRAMLPSTDAELEAWARREYPADMWLYDLIQERFDYQGTWQNLLRGSGEFLRFEYPLTPRQTNCRPSVLALQRVAKTAGFTLTLTPTGGIPLPEYRWAEDPLSIRNVRIERGVAAVAAASLPPPTPRPAGYSLRVAEDDQQASAIVAHLLITGRIAGGPVAEMSPKWEALLLSRLSATPPTTDGCGCGPTFAARLQALLDERKELITPTGNCRAPK